MTFEETRKALLRRPVSFALLSALLVILAAHAVALPVAQWQPDEFVLLHGVDQRGFAYIWERITGWSPRPVSEMMIWLYAAAVKATGRPLIVNSLACLWTASAIVIYAACRRVHAMPFALTAILVSGFLLTEKPSVYYWPVGSFAYLTTVSAIAVSCLLAGKAEPTSGERAVLSLALTIACGSSEMGTAFTLIYCSVRSLMLIVERNGTWEELYTFILPTLMGLFIMFVFLTNRAQITAEAMVTESVTLRNTRESLLHALSPFLHQTLGLSARGEVSGGMLAGGIVFKLFSLCGFLLFFSEVHPSRRMLGEALSRFAALLSAAYVSIVFSLRQFGTSCCDRHATVRQALVFLALLALAQAIIHSRLLKWRVSSSTGTVVLCSSVLVLSISRFAALGAAFHDVHAVIAARSDTWFSGRMPGSTMTFYDWPDTRLADQWGFPIGARYSRAEGKGGWAASSVMDFFSKEDMVIDRR